MGEVGRLRHRQHGHVVRLQVAEMPVALRSPHLVGEAAAAAHQRDAPAAELGEQFQPLRQHRVIVEAAADLHHPHQACSCSYSAATATAGAPTWIQPATPSAAPLAMRATSLA